VARWSELEADASDFAAAVRGFLDARKHKVLGTLRRDGSPRLSGSEADVVEGDLWFGSLWQARKALDLQRDPRFALHSGSEDPPGWKGDAKIAGRAEEVTDPDTIARVMATMGGGGPSGPVHLFRADIQEVSLVRLGEPADHLVIEHWREGRGLSPSRRR
jgi:hypothetical protein